VPVASLFKAIQSGKKTGAFCTVVYYLTIHLTVHFQALWVYSAGVNCGLVYLPIRNFTLLEIFLQRSKILITLLCLHPLPFEFFIEVPDSRKQYLSNAIGAEIPSDIPEHFQIPKSYVTQLKFLLAMLLNSFD